MPTKFKMRREPLSESELDAAADIARACDIPEFAARVLLARGISDACEAKRFCNPSLDRDWLNPYGIANMEPLVDRLEAAIDARERIVVFGDFDLDGISATALMTRAIRALGGKVTPFIPHRFDEGYGITDAAIERLLELEPELLVTVDCGISCKDEVDKLRSYGVDVLITDHHEPGHSIPQGVPIVNPKAEEGNPSSILAGVGVALKVVEALGSRFGYPHLWRSYTDLATLGTVADMMPMIDENRALASDGLAAMNEDPRPAIAALMAASDMGDKTLTSSNLSFSLVPRLNAAGRMGMAELALDLLLSDSYEEASAYAQRLNEVNDMRRKIEVELAALAKEEAERTFRDRRVLVVAGKGWHEGVKGIVASRLASIYKVPALLFTIDDDGEAHGSGRSVGDINLFKAVDSLSDMLIRYGGHEAAVGVTLAADRIDEFSDMLNEYMSAIPDSEFSSSALVDAVVDLEELDIDSVRQLGKLAPFGLENPEPILMARDVIVDQCRAVGADKNHLSCKLTDGRSSLSGIMFRCDQIDRLLSNDSVADALFSVEVDQWRGRSNVKAMLKGIEIPDPTAMADSSTSEERDFLESLFASDRTEASECEGDPGSCSAACDRRRCEELRCMCAEELRDAIISSLIGDATPHEAQCELLDRLEDGCSVLGIMATGRGKSLVFQVHAALMALKQRKASLFVYPLRALMADQAFHITERFRELGIECRVLNGETPDSERESTYKGLADGTVDIVITTPEFLSFHVDRLAECDRIGFVVIDEAHHVGQSREGNRPAYGDLGKLISRLGDPVVLAVTATADSRISDSIFTTLPIREKVIDDTSRDNLHVDDQRGIKRKDEYAAHIAAKGEKTIVYVNSREMSVGVARKLRKMLPQLADQIGFYNAGLSREERMRIEGLFRDGDLKVLCATSAFGEGIDIPNVRHVILYHMPFSDVALNQMSGRAGRDGNDSWVHLLYGSKDASINADILEGMSPGRDVLALIYRALKEMQRSTSDPFISIGLEELADRASTTSVRVTASAASCGITVFSELGLIRSEAVFDGSGSRYSICVAETSEKVDLSDSVRYQEGIDDMQDFLGFREWAMVAGRDELTTWITHPIIP